LCFGLGFLDWIGGEAFLMVGFVEYSSAINPYFEGAYGCDPICDQVFVGQSTSTYLFVCWSFGVKPENGWVSTYIQDHTRQR
jgi:hypothetical protein